MTRATGIRIVSLVAGSLAAGLVLGAAGQVTPAMYSGLRWRCLGPYGGAVAAVTGTPGQPGRYALLTPNREVWQTTDGGETWQESHPPEMPTGATEWTDPQDARRIIRATATGVEITLDGGGHWTAWHNLPIAQVQSVTVSGQFPAVVQATLADGKSVSLPLRDDVGAAGGSAPAAPAAPAGLKFRPAAEGVEVSFDDGAAWQSLQLNLPAVEVKQVTVAGDTLVAATWGRSVWVLDDIEPLEQLAAAAPAPGEPGLFHPPTIVRLRRDKSDLRPSDLGAPRIVNPPLGGYFDFYLPKPQGAVTLEVVNAAGLVLHRETGAGAASSEVSSDFWLAIRPEFSTAAAGEVRVAWDGHADPPASPLNKYVRLSPAMSASEPQPGGPLAPAGDYELRLTVDGRRYSQPLHVVDDPRQPVAAAAAHARWEFEQRMIGGLEAAHSGYRQVEALRAALHPYLTATDPDLAQAAQDLDTQLAAIDGSAWNGLVLPDEIETEVEPVEDKDDDIDPPFVPAQSLTKDYDDPTTILGRSYNNADTGPTFANSGQAIAQSLQTAETTDDAPSPLDAGNWSHDCGSLTAVLTAWQQALASASSLNQTLNAQHLKLLPLPAQPVAAPLCGN